MHVPSFAVFGIKGRHYWKQGSPLSQLCNLFKLEEPSVLTNLSTKPTPKHSLHLPFTGRKGIRK